MTFFSVMLVSRVANVFRKAHYNRTLICARYLSFNDKDDSLDKNTENLKTESSSPLSTLEKYRLFKNEELPVILDINEEKFKALQYESQLEDEYQGLDLERGKEGVFDIEEIVELLRREKAKAIFVVNIPKEYKYVNYVVVVSGKTMRHMKAMAEFVRKVYKKKRCSEDPIPKIEGEDSKHWIAMDLGNIALHIFSEDARSTYDLESLWSVGAEYDELCKQPADPLVELLEKHSVYLGDLQPANSRE